MKYVLSTETRAKVIDAISRLHTGKAWDLTIEPHVERRTTDQNALLWRLHTLASEVTGYSPAEMHEVALAHYFGSKRLQIGDGAVVWLPKKRSSSRDKKEFAAFLDAVQAFYAEHLAVWIDQ